VIKGKNKAMPKQNLIAQRTAAKGLVNLATFKRETRLQVISQLTEEIQMVHRGECDAVVAGYINALA